MLAVTKRQKCWLLMLSRCESVEWHFSRPTVVYAEMVYSWSLWFSWYLPFSTPSWLCIAHSFLGKLILQCGSGSHSQKFNFSKDLNHPPVFSLFPLISPPMSLFFQHHILEMTVCTYYFHFLITHHFLTSAKIISVLKFLLMVLLLWRPMTFSFTNFVVLFSKVQAFNLEFCICSTSSQLHFSCCLKVLNNFIFFPQAIEWIKEPFEPKGFSIFSYV
jgi:hypothetical protein